VFAKTSAAIFLLVTTLWASPIWAQQLVDNSVVHGTVNIAFGNKNGIVVLTDSMLTRDGRQLDSPGQKLFRLDDQTVCAIAGFVQAPAVFPDLSTQTASVIREYVTISERLPPQSLADRLRNLMSIFQGYLNLISNTRLASAQPTPLENYELAIIVAGYDLHGKPKIGKVRLTLRWFLDTLKATVKESTVENVSENLTWKLNGMPDVAERYLQHPELVRDDPDLNTYKDSMHLDGGSSLTTEQMVALAKRLAYYTALEHPEVGGNNQIARLTAPHSLKIEPVHFDDPPLPIVNYHLELQGHFVNNAGEITAMWPRGKHGIFIRCSFSGTKQSQELDGNYYIGSQFRDTVLAYDGGKVGFDNTNRVTNSVLVVGPLIRPDDATVRRLAQEFTWLRIVRDFSSGPVSFRMEP
jgi:proteasome subunit B (beta)-like protein